MYIITREHTLQDSVTDSQKVSDIALFLLSIITQVGHSHMYNRRLGVSFQVGVFVIDHAH